MSNAIPYLPRGVRTHYDRIRGRNVLLGPERALMLDEIGHAIIAELDGKRTETQIAADLATRYGAPVEAVSVDVAEFLTDLADKRLVERKDP
ncbi:pyrroloquinoline quinone biosynthesis protein PqqD [Rhodobacterales bacterium 59_46_T64]|nr:pyrroloquinoline quinone biosynthesis protein PqqD [Rhodobacterales bacterium 59_46_T64]